MVDRAVLNETTHACNRILDLAKNQFAVRRLEAAKRSCSSVLAVQSGHGEACYLLAKIHEAAGDYEAAADTIAQVVQPVADQQFLADLYLFHQKCSKLSQAASLLRSCVQQFPACYFPWYYLAVACSGSGDREGFLQAALRASRLCEHVADRHYELAKAYQAEQLLTLAEQQLRICLDIDPLNQTFLNGLGNVLKSIGRADEADVCYSCIVYGTETAPHPAFYTNFLMTLLCTTSHSSEAIFLEHTRWAEQLCKYEIQGPDRFSNNAVPGRKLRVGYVSSDFYSHPVAFFIEPLLTLHNYALFDVYIYSNVASEDYVTEQFRQRPCVWRSIYGLDDETVCGMIQDDAIDILVDLGGHTRSNRLPVFARKPAQVQVTWLGYANTTGLATIDYRFTDAVADPPGLTERLHSEQLYRLPGCFINYHPPLDPPDVAPLPCLENGFITFAAFNNLAKVNQPLLGWWAEILKQTPGSRLVLKDKWFNADEQLKAEWLDRFACLGITADRVQLIGNHATVHEYLQLFSQHDIALDAYPYTGTTTTCESIWMGVPLVTLAGPTHVTRVSASILTDVGAPELIAESAEQYISLAVELAHDQNRLQQYRGKLRSMMQKSSLMDCEGFARKMEAAYRDIWQRWCEQVTGENNAGNG